jgi:hypothetical protein
LASSPRMTELADCMNLRKPDALFIEYPFKNITHSPSTYN